MSWLTKTLPPKIKREEGATRRASLPEGLWSVSISFLLRATLVEQMSVL